MVFRLEDPVKTYLVITALLMGVFALTSCEGSDTTDDPRPVQKTVAERWKGMTEKERKAVCDEARNTPDSVNTDADSGQIPPTGPDYKGMLGALVEAGFAQPEAAAMLPYAANACK